MARLRFAGNAVDQAVGVATAETLIQLLAPTNQRVVLVGYGVHGKGTSNTETPGLVDVADQDTAGTSSALTVQKTDEGLPETVQSSMLEAFTAEPTTTTPLISHTIHPQASLNIRDAFSREIVVAGGNRLGIRVNYAEAQTLSAYMHFEE